MVKVTGWDTIGVTEIGLMDGDKCKLEFTGTDGSVRNIFVPVPTITRLISSFLSILPNADPAKALTDGASLTDIAVASDSNGSQFGLQITTIDSLQHQFVLSPEDTVALYEGLGATLSKHGLVPPPDRPAG